PIDERAVFGGQPGRGAVPKTCTPLIKQKHGAIHLRHISLQKAKKMGHRLSERNPASNSLQDRVLPQSKVHHVLTRFIQFNEAFRYPVAWRLRAHEGLAEVKPRL